MTGTPIKMIHIEDDESGTWLRSDKIEHVYPKNGEKAYYIKVPNWTFRYAKEEDRNRAAAQLLTDLEELHAITRLIQFKEMTPIV